LLGRTGGRNRGTVHQPAGVVPIPAAVIGFVLRRAGGLL
jgi:hypothetical protein